MQRHITAGLLGAAVLGLSMVPALAQDAADPPRVVSCRPVDGHGGTAQIMSLNDVCPQTAFFREDCRRDIDDAGADPHLYGLHCLDQADFRRFSFK